ncbi:MAG: hypothetical protein EA376_10580 [Phycisphaeraceae bacterium]|nr:MAG: hypothetical protein EA376_10580 [Phycisphaeraceae bacterium]
MNSPADAAHDKITEAPEQSTAPAPRRDPALGPDISLALGPMLAASILTPLGVGLVAWPLLGLINPDSIGVIPRAMISVAAVFAGTTLMIQPWKTRPVTQWLHWWLGVLGACFFGTVAIALVLLYSAPPEERAALGVLIAVGHFATLMAASFVVASLVRKGYDTAVAGPAQGAG